LAVGKNSWQKIKNMIAKFNTKTDAQAFADKVYQWIMQNCPNANGTKWQDIDNTFTVQIPQEYEKISYPKAAEIKAACKPEYEKTVSIEPDSAVKMIVP
jgi:hypothetical protein